MRKLISLTLALALALAMLTCAAAEEAAPVRVASMMGPTSMGLVKLMNANDNGESQQAYEFTLSGTANEIVPLLTRGELDIAMIPCNLASVLYNNTKGQIRVLAVNTLGVLYVLESGDEIQSVADLAGKTIYSTGMGTTPEFALNYILAQNGLDPEKDLTVEFKSEAAEVLAALTNDAASIGVLPQPYVTAALAQNDKLRVALSFTEEWDKVTDESRLITGVAVARAAFVEENPEAISTFLEEYAASVEYVNANVDEAAEWIAELGIVAKAPVAKKALPACNIVYIDGEEMKTAVSGYLAVLFEQNPESVGGKLPDEAFYYIP
ncbi:MAG: ABC transporter substrate-binding protein [Clostridia bacterium]|nr:ABC transporter substrate-binding protein [Clostridia bacterium]